MKQLAVASLLRVYSFGVTVRKVLSDSPSDLHWFTNRAFQLKEVLITRYRAVAHIEGLASPLFHL